MSTESRRVQVRPWALDELPLPARGFGVADFGAGTWGEGGGAPGAYADLAEAAVPDPAGWQDRLEAERADAMAEGYRRGHADGEQAARAQREPAVVAAAAALAEAVAAIRAHEARWCGALEENVAALAVLVARQLVQRELASDATVVRPLVASALAQFPLDDAVTVRLHPEDLQVCRALQAEGGVPLPELRWVADAAVERGGCLVEGRERILDGRLDVALERAYRALSGHGA